jgi:hypothetical protein
MQDEGGQTLGKGARASGPLSRWSNHATKRRRLQRRWCAALCVVIVGLLMSGASAQAALVHPYVSQITGPPEEPFGGFSGALCGVSVDPATGEAYAADPGAEPKELEKPSIDVFSSATSGSTLIGRIDKLVGAEAILHEACSTAINDATQHIYVANTGEAEGAEEAEKADVLVYTPAAGKYKFEKKLTIDGSTTPAGRFEAGPLGEREVGPLHIAVAQTTQVLYVSVAVQGVIDEFGPGGEYEKQLTLPKGAAPQSIATDSSGNLFAVVDLSELEHEVEVIDEFNAAGLLVGQIPGPSTRGKQEITGIAVDSPAGHIYTSDAETRAINEYDAAGALMGQITGSGTPPVGSFAEPVGVAVSTEGDVYVADRTQIRRSGSTSIVDIFGPATPGAGPFLESQGVSGVTSTSATLEAEIDPTGVDTKYQFEYTAESGPHAGESVLVPQPEADIGSGESIKRVEAKLQGLNPSTQYRFRTIAHAEGHAAEAGELQAFTTEPEGVEPGLPDGRAWELVSPPDKHGALISALGGLAFTQAAENGTRISYAASSPIVSQPEEPEANAGEAQVLSVRGEKEWSSRQINPPDYPFTTIAALRSLENQFFTSDLSQSLVVPVKEEPPLSENASERTPYLHELNVKCGIKEPTCYQPLVTDKGELADVESQIKFGGGEGVAFGEVLVADTTPDLKHVVLKSELPLQAVFNGQTVVGKGVYEWNADKAPKERLQLVSVLPNGNPANGQTERPVLGVEEAGSENVRNAISSVETPSDETPSDTRVVWQTEAEGGHHLYVRDMAKQDTIQLDSVQGGSGEGKNHPVFQTADAHGSMVFFTDEQKLTSDSTASEGEPDLYVCQVVPKPGGEGPLGCNLSDLTGTKVVKNSGEHAFVQGMLPGASEDGSYVYFVADGVLSEEANGHGDKAKPGMCNPFSPPGATCNLYMRHYNGTEWEQPTFIAALSSTDGPDWAASSSSNEQVTGVQVLLRRLTARVSPNGKYLAFMSDRSLTGFDNADASSGAADEEVFLYGAGANQLACASCNRFGQRPHGVLVAPPNSTGVGELVDRQGNWTGRWLAANVPGWTERNEVTATYQSRYLSDQGRLFFNSSDVLTPADANKTEDVYQYEPSGVGSCNAGSGCVGLISSGTSQEESAFLDASATGGDVFFLTAANLVKTDVDQSIDLYDAHECTTESPCPAPPASNSKCESSTSCQGASSQQTGFGSPASATLSGSGNIQSQGVLPNKVTKLTQAQLLTKALKSCKKFKRKKRRQACERSARKKYGPKKASKGAKKSSRRSKARGK